MSTDGTPAYPPKPFYPAGQFNLTLRNALGPALLLELTRRHDPDAQRLKTNSVAQAAAIEEFRDGSHYCELMQCKERLTETRGLLAKRKQELADGPQAEYDLALAIGTDDEQAKALADLLEAKRAVEPLTTKLEALERILPELESQAVAAARDFASDLQVAGATGARRRREEILADIGKALAPLLTELVIANQKHRPTLSTSQLLGYEPATYAPAAQPSAAPIPPNPTFRKFGFIPKEEEQPLSGMSPKVFADGFKCHPKPGDFQTQPVESEG